MSEEDIRSLGWKVYTDEELYNPFHYIRETVRYIYNRYYTLYLFVDHPKKVIGITYSNPVRCVPKPNREEIIFKGTVKNSSELKVLMNQLHIYE